MQLLWEGSIGVRCVFVVAGEWTANTPQNTLTRSFTEQIPAIQAVMLHLERKGKAPTTRATYEQALLGLAQRTNLQHPEDVELAIARYKVQDPNTRQTTNRSASNRWKSQLCTAYMHYCKYYKINWEMPTYNLDQKGIEIPTPEKCAMLMSASHGTLSIKIDISTQTGLRPIEIQGEKGLKVKDIHADKQSITAVNTKGCNARPPMKITDQLVTKLQTYITTHNLQANDLLFNGEARNYGDHFRRMKNRLAKKLADPSIKAIRLYDLRHYYITNKLRKIQNAEVVRQIVGHKRLNTTQKYFHLLSNQNSEWIVEGTDDKERVKQLLKDDFQYQLTTPDGTMIFRKPK